MRPKTHEERKPPLNRRVLRGLQVLSRSGAAADVLNNLAEFSDVVGILTRGDLNDARVAVEWIARTAAWTEIRHSIPKGPPVGRPFLPEHP